MRELKGSKVKSTPLKHIKVYLFTIYSFNLCNLFVPRFQMVFDDKLCKGVRKRFIPPAQTMTFPANASYDLVIDKVFFPDEANENDCFALADSCSSPHETKCMEGLCMLLLLNAIISCVHEL